MDHVSIGNDVVADFLLGDVGVAADVAVDVVPEAGFVVDGVEADAAVVGQAPLGYKSIDVSALVSERIGREVVGVVAVRTEAGVGVKGGEIDGGVAAVGDSIGGGGGGIVGDGISGGIHDDLAYAGVGCTVGFILGLEAVFGLGKGMGAGLGHPADGGDGDHDVGPGVEGGVDVAVGVVGGGGGFADGGEIPVFGDVVGVGLIVVAGLDLAAAAVEGVVEFAELGGVEDVVDAVDVGADGLAVGGGIDGEGDRAVVEDEDAALAGGDGEVGIVDEAGGDAVGAGWHAGPGEFVRRGAVLAE